MVVKLVLHQNHWPQKSIRHQISKDMKLSPRIIQQTQKINSYTEWLDSIPKLLTDWQKGIMSI